MTCVFLDANVLVPVTVTDLFLTAADFGVFSVHWSAEVIDEAIAAIQRIHPDIPSAVVRRRFDSMNTFFPDAETAWDRSTRDPITVPDEGDRHVVAAAIAANTDTIVTNNVKDFPVSVLAPFGMRAATPDSFLDSLLPLHVNDFISTLTAMSSSMTRPPLAVVDILDSLAKAGLPKFSHRMRSLIDPTYLTT